MPMLERVRAERVIICSFFDAPATRGAGPRPGSRSRSVVQRLRAEADARYLDPDLDLAAEAQATG